MAIGSALAVTGCSQSPRNPDDPVEATYVPHDASAPGDDGAPLDADDDVLASRHRPPPWVGASAVETPPSISPDAALADVEPPSPWLDAALADAALGTHVDGGFVCVNSYPYIGVDPPPTVCDPKTQYCCDYDYADRASEGCYAFDAGPFSRPNNVAMCSYDPVPVAGYCTCRELDDAGALAVSCGSCYGSPPARRRRTVAA